jgi:hypothetical protein
MSYRLLVLPQVETITPALLQKIATLVEGGASVLGAPPRKSPSLINYPKCDQEVEALAAKLWSSGDTVLPRDGESKDTYTNQKRRLPAMKTRWRGPNGYGSRKIDPLRRWKRTNGILVIVLKLKMPRKLTQPK